MLAERLQHRVPEVTLNVISWLQSNRHRKEHAADQRYVDQDRAGLSVIQGRRNLSGKEFTIVSHRVGLGRTQPHSIQLDRGPSVDRSGGSGAGVLPDSRPAVGDTGGAGGGCRVRAARTINAVLPPTTSRPPRSDPIATQSRKESLAPRSMSASTPREPSAFMRTTVQSPSRTFHVSVCVPTPEAEAAQKC